MFGTSAAIAIALGCGEQIGPDDALVDAGAPDGAVAETGGEADAPPIVGGRSVSRTTPRPSSAPRFDDVRLRALP